MSTATTTRRFNPRYRRNDQISRLRKRCCLYESALNALPDAIHILHTRTGLPVFENHSFRKRCQRPEDQSRQQKKIAPEIEIKELSNRFRLVWEKTTEQQTLLSVFNAMPQIVWLAKPDGSISHFSQQWFDHVGTAAGLTWECFIHPGDLERTQSVWSHSLTTLQPYEIEYRIRGKDGTFQWFLGRANPRLDENGNVLHWIGTCTDIGSTKQTELNLELAKSQLDSEKRLLSTVLEQLPVAVVVGLPPNGELVVTNRKLFKIWRQEEFDLPGNIEKYNIWQAFHPDGRPYEGRDWPLARSILHGEVVVDEDTSVKFGDGSHGIVRLNSAPVRDEQGRILAGVVIVEDVTGITRMTEERATMMAREQTALEACRLKSEFLANMSHEIRTPLNGVIGMADLLMETSLFANQEEYVSTIRKSGNLLLVIINDILDFSKVEAGKLQLERAPFHLQDIVIHVEKQLRPAADRQNIDFVIDVDPSLPPSIMGDSKRIKQILYNLVGNAIKFTKHGSVTLKIRPGEFDHGCSTYPLHIDVIDTGIGISETNQLRLFQPFTQADMSTTRKYGGTGLGLSICQGLVQLMGGSIQVQSKMNEGSMFSVDIQVEPANEHEIERPVSLSHKQVSSVSFCGFAALVAEDNKVNQMIVHKVLLKFKFSEVRITSNGKEVYETFCENPTKYAFILMDCQMPLMDGYEAARSIRDYERQNSLAPIPIIALTASALQSDIQACREAGMNDHIAKPFTHQVMASVLKRWFLERDKISRKNIGFML